MLAAIALRPLQSNSQVSTRPHTQSLPRIDKVIELMVREAFIPQQTRSDAVRQQTFVNMGKLVQFIFNCTPAKPTWTGNKQFKHVDCKGEYRIKNFLDVMASIGDMAKKTREGLYAHEIVGWSKIHHHMQFEIHNKAQGSEIVKHFGGRNARYVDHYLNVGKKHYAELFPNQVPATKIFGGPGNHLEMLERALSQGKFFSEEGTNGSLERGYEILKESDALKHKAAMIAMPNILPGVTGNGGVQTSGMGVNTAWTPGGNAPSIVPTFSVSNNNAGLVYGYQSPL